MKQLKFKYIFIFLFVFFLLFLLKSDSFGFSFVGSDGEKYEILDFPSDVKDYYIIFKEGNYFYLAYPEGVPEEEYANLIFRRAGNKVGFCIDLQQIEGSEHYLSCYRYNFTDSSPSWKKWVTKIPDINSKNNYIIFSSQDILDMNTEEVFYKSSSFSFIYKDLTWFVPALPEAYNDGRPFFISASTDGAFNGYILAFPKDFINHNDIKFYNNRPDYPEGIFYNSDGNINPSGAWIFFTCDIDKFFWSDINISTDFYMWLENPDLDMYQDVIYSSIPIYDSSGNIYFENGELIQYNFSITLSNTQSTIEPIVAYSNWFNWDTGYVVQISRDNGKTYEEMEIEVDTQNNNDYRYYSLIYGNGTYFFKFFWFISDTEYKEYYITLNVTNFNIPGGNYDDENYIPSPYMTLDYNEEKECFILKTQNIYLNKSLFYKCLYSDIGGVDYSLYSEMQMEMINNEDFRLYRMLFLF